MENVMSYCLNFWKYLASWNVVSATKSCHWCRRICYLSGLWHLNKMWANWASQPWKMTPRDCCPCPSLRSLQSPTLSGRTLDWTFAKNSRKWWYNILDKKKKTPQFSSGLSVGLSDGLWTEFQESADCDIYIYLPNHLNLTLNLTWTQTLTQTLT